MRLPLATSAAVLTELFHLLRNQPLQQALAWSFVRSAAVTVLAIDDADLPGLEALMRKYADRPMDFADATLVHLAGRESLTTVFTIDHDDFEIPHRWPTALSHRARPLSRTPRKLAQIAC